MGQAESFYDSELCPSCGNFVDDIDAETGWCLECSGNKQTRCIACMRLFKKDQPHRQLCPYCREERWLLRHADEIEEMLALGATLSFAKREVYYRNRPVCISCNQPIKGRGTASGANFCTRTIECRRWRRRYRTLREGFQRKGILDPAKQAIAQVSAEIFAEGYRLDIR